MTESKALVQVSGGAASYLAWKLAADEFGHDNTDALFADVLTEDPDLYRFLGDCERRLNLPLIRLADMREASHYGPAGPMLKRAERALERAVSDLHSEYDGRWHAPKLSPPAEGGEG